MSKPKIAYIDIETALFPVLVFGLGKQVVTHKQIMPGFQPGIICACWKWHGKKRVHSVDWGKNQDTEKVIKTLDKEVISKADIIIAHNGDKFDMRHINTHRLVNKLPPLPEVATEDTLKQCRKHFYLPSYSLDYISTLLLGDQKLKTDFKLWVDIVVHKKVTALRRMVKYCKKDVKLLEKVEQILAPYVEHKVHRGIIKNGNRDSCPNCGETKLQKMGFYVTKVGKYQRYRCTSCGHTHKDSRQVKSEK